MRILQVVTDTDRRGAQVFATHLDRALRDRGHDVQTAAMRPGTIGGLDIDVLAARWPSTTALARLRTRMADVDVTIAHGSATGPACAIAGVGPGRPFVYRQVSDSQFWAPTRAKRTRTRIALGQARVVVALSEFNRSQLVKRIGVRTNRIITIPNGVPATDFRPPTAGERAEARLALALPDAPTALFIGALVPEKGADLAIWSLRDTASAHLVVAGAGPEREHLERLAGALAPGRVHFVGTTANAAALYHAADVFILPSRGGDSMPAVLLEAGLCGLAVVSTRVGAIPEVVPDGTTGFVVSPDDLSALQAAIELLLGDASIRATMGAAARERCLRRYDVDRVARQWERVLERAVKHE